MAGDLEVYEAKEKILEISDAIGIGPTPEVAASYATKKMFTRWVAIRKELGMPYNEPAV
jgi:hypothetical protein